MILNEFYLYVLIIKAFIYTTTATIMMIRCTWLNNFMKLSEYLNIIDIYRTLL